MRVATTAEMRRLEQASVDSGRSSWAGLMEEAGWGIAQKAMELLGTIVDRRVVVLVGPGNNGGDGLVVARHLHDAGAQVILYIWNRTWDPQDTNWRRCRERELTELIATEDTALAQLRQRLTGAALVIDGLLGIGISRPLDGLLAALVTAVNACRTHTTLLRPTILAIDIPTGIHSDTGAVMGVALRADRTVATGLPKRGALLYPGRSYVGTLDVVGIELPAVEMEKLMSETAMQRSALRALLPARPDDSHKGTYGKVLVVAGSFNYPGAAVLATASVARVGAGLVTLAATRGVLGLTSGGRIPEITLLPLGESAGEVSERAAEDVLEKIADYQALLIGPGLGQEKSTSQFLQRLLGIEQPRSTRRVGFRVASAESEPAESSHEQRELPPLVLDADALNILAQLENWPQHLPEQRCILTPHPGEMQRLLGTETLDDDRVQVATAAAADWQQVVVLKGATTVIAAPDGRNVVHAAGNPALATAGTGDVLAGAIAGLLAQQLTPYDAAVLGVHLHGMAGALVRDEVGPMGALASDLIPRLPFALQELAAD